MNYRAGILLAIGLCLPAASQAFNYEMNLVNKPDLQRYSEWCYIQFDDNHRGQPSNQIPSQLSSAIINMPKLARGIQFSWYSPDPVIQNTQASPYASINPSTLPLRHHNKLLLLQSIAYWDIAWKLFIGFDMGTAGTPPAPGSLKPCDAMQFTPTIS